MRFFLRLIGLLFIAIHVQAARAEDAVKIQRYGRKQPGTAKVVIVPDTPLVHTTQVLPADGNGKPEGDAGQQAERVLDRLADVLRIAGSNAEQVVKLNVYVAKDEFVSAVQGVIAQRFAHHPPAVCWVTTALPNGSLVAADAVAVAGSAVARSTSPLASAAVLPAGSRVYISGQAEKGADLAECTRLTLGSLRRTLEFLKLRDEDVVQVKSFLTPMSDAEVVQREITKFFGGRSPPVAFVEWKSTLPIEIEMVVSGGPARDGELLEFLTPPGMTTPTIYCRVCRIARGPSIFFSGLYGSTNETASAETDSLFVDLRHWLRETGSDFRHLVKATYYVSNEGTSKSLNELRPNYYDPKRPPAASKALVSGVGQAGRAITLDMIAVPAR